MSVVLDSIPYARFLGVEVDRTGGILECVLPFREEIIGNPILPAIHGGVIGAFLELTALLRLIDESGTDRVAKPINFAIDYLRSAGPTAARAGMARRPYAPGGIGQRKILGVNAQARGPGTRRATLIRPDHRG